MDSPKESEKDSSVKERSSDIASKIFIPISVGVESSSKSGNDRNLPYTLTSSQINNEAELRFLRAKVKILTADIEKHRDDHKKKVDELKAFDAELHTVKEERNKALQQLSMSENKVSRITRTLAEQANNIKMLESIKSRLTQELAVAKKDSKSSSQVVATLEIRLNRSLEEIENLRSSLQDKRGHEKDDHEAQRKVIENQSTVIQKLERQHAELIMAFRRQMMLCHNLHRQKELLANNAALQLADTKFGNLLNSKKGTK
ncbi:testis-expressed protein 9-like isoform X2 [Neocloeon triangulifer]|uniref:testis-expressed protein 9-like isoform X2 n=1 Tax=Neocloeon triangulifer TaxID=2078957 RepID=UPI00286F8D9D|nr:testis-expressed protein 9-like isoform X2 [Neocloeon triangulifer]